MRPRKEQASRRAVLAALAICGSLSFGPSYAVDKACMHSGLEIERFIESGGMVHNAEISAWNSKKIGAIHGCLDKQNNVCIVGSWGDDPVLWTALKVNQSLHAESAEENPQVEAGVIDFVDGRHRRLCLIGQPSFGTDGLWIMEAWLWEGGTLRRLYYGPFAQGDSQNPDGFRDQMIRQAKSIHQ